MFKAVLFDYDGTLAKTMEDNFEAWRRSLAEFGVQLKPIDYYPFEGISLIKMAQEYIQKYQLDIKDKDLVNKKEQYYLNNYKFSLYPGVNELLDILKQKGVKMAMVTTGLFNRIIKTTPTEEFLGKFTCFLTGDFVSRKAESYINACSAMNILPEYALAIENSPSGVNEAREAGLYCIGVCSTLGKEYFEGLADEIVDSFDQLFNLECIKELIK